MQVPNIEVIPIRPATRRAAQTTLDVLVRITPPAVSVQAAPRPPLNLSLVLDHSGSMASGNKINFARQAAIYAVEQLYSTDRVSVVIFDDQVEVVWPSSLVHNRDAIIETIRQVVPDGTTALHPGWSAGADQVALHRQAEGIHRVLLLTDGLANVGTTNPDVICSAVNRQLVQHGVSTTTLGMGDDYNEELLEAMALSGDGNYYYIESPTQLADIFQSEIHGLAATLGTKVSLGLEPQNGAEVLDVLNDLGRNEHGRLKLANLTLNRPLETVFRLVIPPIATASEVCRFRLAWDLPQGSGRQVRYATLALAGVSDADWDALPENAEVRERAVLLLVARDKRLAAAAVDRGDFATAGHHLGLCRGMVQSVPASANTIGELQDLDEVDSSLANNDAAKFKKQARYQSHKRTRQ